MIRACQFVISDVLTYGMLLTREYCKFTKKYDVLTLLLLNYT